MSDDSTQVGEMIRSGRYFRESREWYQTLYIGPIAERTFFLIVAGLAGIIALLAVLALAELMPIHGRPAVLLASDRPEETRPQAVPINPQHRNLNAAMEEFMLRAYVILRESYEAKNYAPNFAFVTAHSDTATGTAYSTQYGNTNPQSPAALLGETGVRRTTIESIRLEGRGDPRTATVRFSTQLEGVNSDAITRWTAVIQYHYSDLTVQSAPDPVTGDDTIATHDPQFQVVSYALTQNP